MTQLEGNGDTLGEIGDELCSSDDLQTRSLPPQLGFSDYLDVLNFNPGAEGVIDSCRYLAFNAIRSNHAKPKPPGAALSKSTAVDDILDQCSKKVEGSMSTLSSLSP